MKVKDLIAQQDKDIADLEQRLNETECQLHKYQNMTRLPSAEATASLLQLKTKESVSARKKLAVFKNAVKSLIILLEASE